MKTYCIDHANTCNMLGITCDIVTIPSLLSYFEKAIILGKKNCIVSGHNLHSIYLCQRDHGMCEFYEKSSLTYIDGMPLILWGRTIGYRLKQYNRTPYLDWNEAFYRLAESRGWRVYYVGGRKSSVKKASLYFSELYPMLQIRFHHGYLSSEDDLSVYGEIEKFKPNVILVGMGMPRQEQWILKSYEHICSNVIVSGGAMIEYHIKEQFPCPRWLSKLGMEWIFRLSTQPRRLARRCLVEPFLIMNLFVKDILLVFSK